MLIKSLLLLTILSPLTSLAKTPYPQCASGGWTCNRLQPCCSTLEYCHQGTCKTLRPIYALDPKKKAITQAMKKPSELTCVVTSSVELTHL